MGTLSRVSQKIFPVSLFERNFTMKSFPSVDGMVHLDTMRHLLRE